MSMDHQPATGFLAQTDGQTEWHIQNMEQYL
jgi:hypothetical protein